MSLEAARQSTKSYFGGLDEMQCRENVTAAEVTEDDNGLRLLAANGDWKRVCDLAEKLEREKSSVENYVDHLPYVLVRITAYFKLRQIASAVSLVELLGDVETNSQYLDPVTKENLVPFSLRYLCALMPHYAGDSQKAIRNLNRLLNVCQQEKDKNNGGLWNQRWERVLRTIIALYVCVGEYETSVRLFERVLENVTKETRFPPETKDLGTVGHVLLLQQFACLCLHIGKVSLARQQMEKIHQKSEEAARNTFVKEYIAYIEKMNQGFLLVFNGRMSEASQLFKEIAAQDLSRVLPSSDVDASNSANSNNSNHDLQTLVEYLHTANQISHMTCFTNAQCEEGADAKRILKNSISLMESYLKENPKSLLCSSGFINQAVRLYVLNSQDKKADFEKLTNLLETYVLEKSAIPNLETLL